MTTTSGPCDYDVLVIGSGWGGSVTALRLTEKGYRVGVLEAGRRFADSGFPATSAEVRRFLWAPKLGCRGIQRIHLLKDVIIPAGPASAAAPWSIRSSTVRSAGSS
jgi:cholesterol oxidase